MTPITALSCSARDAPLEDTSPGADAPLSFVLYLISVQADALTTNIHQVQHLFSGNLRNQYPAYPRTPVFSPFCAFPRGYGRLQVLTIPERPSPE